MPYFEDLSYEERLQEMHLTTIKERRGRDLITTYELMNNLEETDRKDLIMRRKGDVRYLRTQEKLQKDFCLNDTKCTVFPKEV